MWEDPSSINNATNKSKQQRREGAGVKWWFGGIMRMVKETKSLARERDDLRGGVRSSWWKAGL